MTTKANLLSTFVVCVSLFFTSCAIDGSDSNEPTTKADNPSSSVTPNEEVLKSFDIRFPNAKDVVWSTNDSYYVADFSEFSSVINAWFEQEGEWVLSKSSLASSELQKEISEAFLSSPYAMNQVTGRSKLERKGLGDIYVIGTNSNTQHINVYYTEKGDFIRVAKDYGNYTDTPIEISEKVNAVVDSRFGTIEMLDIWNDSLGSKIGLIENNIYKVAALDGGYDWICTIWTINEQAVPGVVLDGFNKSTYGDNNVESIKIMENETEFSYLFYFSEDGKHKIATLKESGSIKSVLSY